MPSLRMRGDKPPIPTGSYKVVLNGAYVNALLIFMVTPCINDINPFLVQLMHLYSLLKQD